jgi:nitrite reductase/ring-hydroxylating ferredoxin subunit/multimeric flavodoxin WrbA
MADSNWQDAGAVEELKKKPLHALELGGQAIALTFADGKFGALDGVCPHAGGPLGEAALTGSNLTCPWHQWNFDRCSGKNAAAGGDARSFAIKEEGGHLFVDIASGTAVKKEKHPLDREPKREKGSIRVLGISTTAMNLETPRFSTSEKLLETSLEHAKSLGAETRLIKLNELRVRNCEGYYSISAESCTWPCTITQADKNDEMEKVYEALVFWADVVLVSTPIRWGVASSLYFKMAERMNCIQNQVTIADRVLIQNKVASFIITGGQDNIQAVAGQMLTFFGEIGFHFPQFPFIAHSRGWAAEDMEKNIDYVRESDDLKAGAKDLAERCVDFAKRLIDTPQKPVCKSGRKAQPVGRTK